MIRPQNDWILVEKVEETKRGLLVVPENHRNADTHRLGKVVALPPPGDADFNFNVTAAVGDVIIYDERSSLTGTANGQEFIFARARDVIGVIS